MFLNHRRWVARIWRVLLAGAFLYAAPDVRAQIEWSSNTTVQAGVDAWYLAPDQHDVSRHVALAVADSNTQWKYRTASPWYTLQSHVRIGSQGELVLRGKANQDFGASADQISYDHSISPALGVRAGIMDYRATWCRAYDLDNPWVRENDPFCSDKDVNLATASAPAIQVYTNSSWADYRVQSVAGLYRPTAFNYQPREFTNLILSETSTVYKNHKHALSLNAVNVHTATEWRFSWVGAKQSLFDSDFIQLNDPQFFPATQLKYHQNVNTYFAGVSWQVTPKLRSRLTRFHTNLKARCELLNPAAGEPCTNEFNIASMILEMNYQAGTQDVLSFAASNYALKQKNLYEAKNRTVSVAWRRDWGGGWFSALQLTNAHVSVPYNNDIQRVPYKAGKSHTWGAGLRIGYQL